MTEGQGNSCGWPLLNAGSAPHLGGGQNAMRAALRGGRRGLSWRPLPSPALPPSRWWPVCPGGSRSFLPVSPPEGFPGIKGHTPLGLLWAELRPQWAPCGAVSEAPLAFQAASVVRVPGRGHQHHVTGGCPRTCVKPEAPSLAEWQSTVGAQDRPAGGPLSSGSCLTIQSKGRMWLWGKGHLGPLGTRPSGGLSLLVL